ncbi:hypothetical protein TB2_046951 [Malus domestica]
MFAYTFRSLSWLLPLLLLFPLSLPAIELKSRGLSCSSRPRGRSLGFVFPHLGLAAIVAKFNFPNNLPEISGGKLLSTGKIQVEAEWFAEILRCHQSETQAEMPQRRRFLVFVQ